MRILYPKLPCNMAHALRVFSLLSNETAFFFIKDVFLTVLPEFLPAALPILSYCVPLTFGL